MDKAREHIPVGVRADIPGSSSMARSYRNYVSTARHEAGDHLLDAAHIEIPAHLNNKVILFDMVNDGTILVFCSEFGKMLLSRGKNICIDGTFKVQRKIFMIFLNFFKCRPLAFAQLYTINVMIDETAVPAVYGLLPGKTEATYEKLFKAVHEFVPEWKPANVICDFEIAAMNAIKKVLVLL